MLHLTRPSSSPHAFFLPTIASPLSPRSPNIYGRRHQLQMSSGNNDTDKASAEQARTKAGAFTFTVAAPSKPTPFSQRAIQKAPSPRPDELQDRRRARFLHKVRDQRDERRYEARGDDMMRSDFARRQRAYERELALSAPPTDLLDEEDDDREADLPGWSQGSQMQWSQQQEDVEAEEFERGEEEEMRALLEYMPEDETDEGGSLWSDDVDYDALFEEVIAQDQGRDGMDGLLLLQHQGEEGEEMDMS